MSTDLEAMAADETNLRLTSELISATREALRLYREHLEKVILDLQELRGLFKSRSNLTPLTYEEHQFWGELAEYQNTLATQRTLLQNVASQTLNRLSELSQVQASRRITPPPTKIPF